MLRYAGEQAMAGRPLFAGPLRAVLHAVFQVPASWSNKKREAALAGLAFHTGRPDADNIFKLTDGLNGVVWHDDSQIVEAHVFKLYGEKPMFRVEVWEITGTIL
jgi:Holliday junction resolvase RusA-like endonuclease